MEIGQVGKFPDGIELGDKRRIRAGEVLAGHRSETRPSWRGGPLNWGVRRRTRCPEPAWGQNLILLARVGGDQGADLQRTAETLHCPRFAWGPSSITGKKGASGRVDVSPHLTTLNFICFRSMV